MGYGMALNLRSKMNKDQTLFICDISNEAIDRFKTELNDEGPIEVVPNAAEAAKAAVCQQPSIGPQT